MVEPVRQRRAGHGDAEDAEDPEPVLRCQVEHLGRAEVSVMRDVAPLPNISR